MATQLLFAASGVGWMLFSAYDLFVHTFGDCGDNTACSAYKDAYFGLAFWRGLAVAIVLVIAYRFFRKEPDV